MKVLCFGEILLRVSPAADWIKQHSLSVYVGGAEANVATALGLWHVPVKYMTAMPANYMANNIEEYLQSKSIDTSAIHHSGARIGTYYMPQGADLKNAGVIYDRFFSSFYDLKPGMIDWEEAFKDVSWFHFTAISPALNENVAAVCKEALEIATAKGITTSIDLNYRAKLWQYGKKPVEVVPELAQYCDFIMGNIWAANTLLGIPVDPEIHIRHKREEYLAHVLETSKAIQEKFPRCKTVANTFRFDFGAKGIEYFCTIFDGDKQYQSIDFNTDSIVDKAGSGDCFMGGLIYGFHNKLPLQDTINYAAAAAFGKLNEVGDATNQTTEDVYNTLKKYEQKATVI